MEQKKELYELLEEEVVYFTEHNELLNTPTNQKNRDEQVKVIKSIFDNLDKTDIKINVSIKDTNNVSIDEFIEINNQYFTKKLKMFFKNIEFTEHIELYTHAFIIDSLIRTFAKYLKLDFMEFLDNSSGTSNSINLATAVIALLNSYNKFLYCVSENINCFIEEIKKQNLDFKTVKDINWIIDNYSLFKNIIENVNNSIPLTESQEKLKKVNEQTLENLTEEQKKELIDNFANFISINSLNEIVINHINEKLLKRDQPEFSLIPIDKTTEIFNPYNQSFKDGIPDGQLQFSISNKNENMYTTMSIDFSQLEISKLSDKNLTPYDNDAFNAINNYFYNGINQVTLDDIWKLHNTSRMNKSQREKLLNSIKKMSKIRITLDNSEAIKNGYAMDKITYDGPLLPIEIIEMESKGKTTTVISKLKSSSNSYAVTPLFDYAVFILKQFTTIKTDAIKTPPHIQYTDTTIALRQYLIHRINGRYYQSKKIPKEKRKDTTILLTSLYEKTGKTKEFIPRTNNLSRDQETIIKTAKRFLDIWQNIDKMFESYSIKSDRIIIKYHK